MGLTTESNKQQLVDQLFESSDLDLIEGAADLVIDGRFSVEDTFKYLGTKKHGVFYGFILEPFNDRFSHIAVGHLPADTDVISRITFGGAIGFSLEALAEKFGAYRVAYNHRDEFAGFFFNELPAGLKAAELNFSHYDLMFDKETDTIFERKDKERTEVEPADIKFNHFTLLF